MTENPISPVPREEANVSRNSILVKTHIFFQTNRKETHGLRLQNWRQEEGREEQAN
jgi:hypothetical protein